nr:AraC family transcriptional regulator [Clostridia bacterium]
MPIILDRQLREQIPHTATEFPITYYHDELESLPDRAGPLHWHPDFEIATAASGVLDYQVGQQHITLEPGDSVFVNGNLLHGIRQLSGDVPDPMPNIVFSGVLISGENGTIYKKYILPISQCDTMPFIVFRHDNAAHGEVNRLIHEIYRLMSECGYLYELAVQRCISRIFEYILSNFDTLPRSETVRVQIKSQIRFRKMLAYIYEHYAESVTLEDIADAANVSRSEAGRCFNTYMGCSPIDALIRHRLHTAHRMLSEKTLTLQEVSFACGFNSVSYFSRRFRDLYGYAPGQHGNLGK